MEKKKNDFIAQGSILAIASILVRVMGMIYRIPMTAIIGDKGNGFYSYAYSVYTILLLLSSYSLPLAVSKMVSAKAQLGQWRNVKRVFICAIAFAIGIGTTFGLIVLIGAQFFTRVFFHRHDKNQSQCQENHCGKRRNNTKSCNNCTYQIQGSWYTE